MKVRLEHIGDASSREADIEVDWPAVPHKDDYIEVTIDGEEFTGTVRIVMWGDDGVPLVRFR